MKKRLVFSVIVISIIFVSCSKSSSTTTPQITIASVSTTRMTDNSTATQPVTFTFYAGDTFFNWSGNDTNHLAQLEVEKGTNNWYLHGSQRATIKGPMPWDYIELGFKTTNNVLYQKEYSGGDGVWCHFDHNQTSTDAGTPDSLIMNITSIHDGLVDGTFSNRSADGQTLVINQGVFKNVPIIAF